ncbi:MAG: hypothetical protein DMF80_14270 [Acidobacteria bacterium]|nr:MAG: hypothetical protein DMF80_14270 [Acidobacteriota bacterium]PYQ20956.1 MAG: hypothetical protein DMF81_16980 [Acidobacteriota bacterium]
MILPSFSSSSACRPRSGAACRPAGFPCPRGHSCGSWSCTYRPGSRRRRFWRRDLWQ